MLASASQSIRRRIFATTRYYPSSTVSSAIRKMTSASSPTPVEDAMRDKVRNSICLFFFFFYFSAPINSTANTHTIRPQLVAAFTPTTLLIRNDSHKHAHHAPMQGVTSKETHFQYVPSLSVLSLEPYIQVTYNYISSVTITSESFQSKSQPARHRLVYALLKEEMAREGGIHALQLRTRTPEEERRQEEQEKQAQ